MIHIDFQSIKVYRLLKFINIGQLMIWQNKSNKDSRNKPSTSQTDKQGRKDLINLVEDDEQQRQRQIRHHHKKSSNYHHQKNRNNSFDKHKNKKETHQSKKQLPNKIIIIGQQQPMPINVKQKIDKKQGSHVVDSEEMLIHYRLMNQNRYRVTSDRILTKRIAYDFDISKIMAKNRDGLEKSLYESQSMEQQQFSIQDKSFNQERPFKRRKRYFDGGLNDKIIRRFMKCANCGKEGHASDRCLDQKSKVKCYYCLGRHHCMNCPDFICDKCGQIQHGIQQCQKQKQKLVCIRCSLFGHEALLECGRVLLSTRRNNQQYQSKFSQIAQSDIEHLVYYQNADNPNYRYFQGISLAKKQASQYQASQTEEAQISPQFYINK